jgi:arsenite methyltransferase
VLIVTSVTWDLPELAERYDRISDLQFRSGRILTERMGINDGDAVLDVGCGTGRLALYVADIIGPSGSVTGLDPSPHRIKVAMNKLKGVAVQNVRFAVGRGEDLSGIPDNAFDHVYFSSVFHWIDDKRTALREAARVLKPGGKVGMTTVNRDFPFDMENIMEGIFSKGIYAGQAKMEEERMKLVNLAELDELFKDAGLGQINIDSVTEAHCFPSAEEMIGFMEASSFGNFLGFLPERLHADAREDIRKGLEGRRTAKGVELASNTIYAIASKPL